GRVDRAVGPTAPAQAVVTRHEGAPATCPGARCGCTSADILGHFRPSPPLHLSQPADAGEQDGGGRAKNAVGAHPAAPRPRPHRPPPPPPPPPGRAPGPAAPPPPPRLPPPPPRRAPPREAPPGRAPRRPDGAGAAPRQAPGGPQAAETAGRREVSVPISPPP